MAKWYNPVTWFRKPEPKPTPSPSKYFSPETLGKAAKAAGASGVTVEGGTLSGGTKTVTSGGVVTSAGRVTSSYHRGGGGGVSPPPTPTSAPGQVVSIPSAEVKPQEKVITPTAQTLQPATEDVGWYKEMETQASKKLYALTGFSEEQHERQRRDVLESEKWLKERAKKSTQALKDWGVKSWFAEFGGWIAERGVDMGTWISGGVGTLGKTTIDKPITTPLKYAAYGAAGYGIGFGVSGTLAGASAISPIVGTVAQVGFTGTGLGLGGFYTYGVGKQLYEAPTSFERGGIIGTEGLKIAAISGGAMSGQKGWQKTAGWWRTRGRTEIPAEKLIPAEILAGKKTFVESPTRRISQREYLRLFKEESQVIPGIKEPIAYHQTPKVWWKGKQLKVTQPGTSEFEGLYGASKVSPHFLKVGGEYKIFSLKDWVGPPPKAPGTVGIIPTKFIGGKVYRTHYEVSHKIPSKIPSTVALPGQAFVPAIKPEVEAIFPMGTGATKVSTKFFYKWKGVRIPIDVYKTTTTPSPTAIPLITSTTDISKAVSSYGAMPSYSFISPTSLASLGLSSLVKPSKLSTPPYPSKSSYTPSSYKSSYVPSYKPSYDPSYAPSISKPSYKPSYDPSYAPSYKPSYDPSYAPSIKSTSYISPPPLSWFPKPKISIIGGRQLPAKQVFGYTPSFAGFTWKIKAPQIPKTPFGKFTGLEIRPIIPGGIKLKI